MSRLILALLLALPLAACDGAAEGAEDRDGRLRVVATTAIIGALAREVGGDHIALTVLARPGIDPHDYELVASDRRELDRAKIVLANGLGLDERLTRAADPDRVVVVTAGVAVRRGAKDGEVDPHVWQDPHNVKVMTNNLARALIAADPGHASAYESRAAAYDSILDDTDLQIRALIESIPPANRRVVTNHDALGYFLERYGLAFVGAVIPTTTTQAETSARELAELADRIRREGVRAIFAEASVDPKVARQLARDTGVRIVDDLYSDTPGEPGSGAETVHGLLLANARKIAGALR